MSHAHAGKSLKSENEAKITSTVLYPQSWPHYYLSITHGRRDDKYQELSLAEIVAGYWPDPLIPRFIGGGTFLTSQTSGFINVFFLALRLAGCVKFHGAVLLEVERKLLK